MPPTRGNTGSSSSQDPVLQLLQMMMAEREEGRAERQANLVAMQQIAQMANNNQGNGNHDHPGSKLKNFQNTNLPMFSNTSRTTLVLEFDSGATAETLQYRPAIDPQQLTALLCECSPALGETHQEYSPLELWRPA